MNFSNFDLNLLRVLQALLIDRSTVKAAERLHLSQPAVSAALRRLRDALGDPLFERQGRALEPTSFALALEGELNDSLRRLEWMLQPSSVFDAQRTTRTFRFSASDYFADYLLPPLLRRLSTEAPNASIQLMPLDSEDHLNSLERFRTDLILFLNVPIPSWMRAKPVFSSRFKVIAARNHPDLMRAGLRPGDRIPLDLYCGSVHGLYSPSGDRETWVDHELGRLGHARHIRATTSTFHSLAKMVAGSPLLATVPALTAVDFGARYGLDVYEHPFTDARSDIMMAWHYRSDPRPEHQWFRGVMESELQRLLPPFD